MQNISHVLDQLQQPWLAGLHPAANVGPEVTVQCLRLLSDAPFALAYMATSSTTRVQLQLERKIDEGSLPFSTYGADDRRQKVIATIVQRRGQGAFRSALLQTYGGRCSMTGSSVADVLEAVHLHPYRGAATNALSNGLFLPADVHTLFDLYLISVEPRSKRVQAVPSIIGTEYGQLNGSRLSTSAEEWQMARADLFEWHRSQCGWQGARPLHRWSTSCSRTHEVLIDVRR